MLQVNEIFKNAVEQDSRTFKARVVLGKDIFEGIKSFALHAASNNSAHISIGGAVAASVQVKMEATTISLESKEITLQIGVLFGTEYIYCDLGKFTPEKVNNDDGIINFCAYDRMYVKFSKAYVSKLEYPADGKEVLKEISNMSGVPLASSIDNLPSGVKIPKRWKETETTYDDEGNEITQGNYVNPFDGYTMQDALGYVAQFYGKYCVINRNGEIELRWYKQADYEISASRYYDDLKKSESLFKLGRIQCDTATATLLSGVGTVGIQIENPVMTQPVLDKICNQLKDFTFQPASVSFLGDPRLDIGDIVTIHDKYGGKIKIPIMKLSMDYDGGLITEIESQGKTEIESGSISSSKGPTAQAIERLNIELVAAKEIIGQKASFDDLKATKATFDKMSASYGEFADLTAKRLDVGEADIKQLQAENVDISGRLTADEAEIKIIKTDKANVKDLDAANARIDSISGNLADYKVVITGSLEAVNAVLGSLDANYAKIDLANIKNGSITTAMIGVGVVGSAQIADGSITDAKIVELTANKITAGTLSVERLIICGDKNSIIYAINNAGELVSQNVNTIDGDVLTKRSITADKIVAGAITANEIAGKTITANKIATGAITTGELAAGSVTAEKIKAGAISADKIAAGAISVDKLTFGLNSNLYNLGYDNFATITESTLLSYFEDYQVKVATEVKECGGSFFAQAPNVPGTNALWLDGRETTEILQSKNGFILGSSKKHDGFITLIPGKKYLISFYIRCPYLSESENRGIEFLIWESKERSHLYNGNILASKKGEYVFCGLQWERKTIKYTCVKDFPYIALGFGYMEAALFIVSGIQVEQVEDLDTEPSPFSVSNVQTVDAKDLENDGIVAISDNLGTFQKGVLKSGNYSGSSGESFPSSGFLIDLNNGYINTPRLRVASNGKTYCNCNGIAVDVNTLVGNYANCYTSASTAAKTVSLSGFELVAGARVCVRFNYANTATNPTLNVNATGAKPIYYKNSNIPAELIEQYTVLELVYSGSYWYVVGNMNILTKGDSINIECFTAGYVTSAGKEVQFCIPVSTPIVGCSSVTIESATGLQIRQNGNYVYGGNASTLVAASSYRGVINRNMVSIAATMPNTTNAVNNAPCGVRAALKLTFS